MGARYQRGWLRPGRRWDQHRSPKWA